MAGSKASVGNRDGGGCGGDEKKLSRLSQPNPTESGSYTKHWGHEMNKSEFLSARSLQTRRGGRQRTPHVRSQCLCAVTELSRGCKMEWDEGGGRGELSPKAEWELQCGGEKGLDTLRTARMPGKGVMEAIMMSPLTDLGVNSNWVEAPSLHLLVKRGGITSPLWTCFVLYRMGIALQT